uniref:Uncharacterized protein n=1 Tax=Meloidogyne javanica TaxID=6303 RepID=A0A915ND12_MELJA
MAVRSSSTCSSGEYILVADLTSKSEVEGAMAFASGKGSDTLWTIKEKRERKGVTTIREDCVYKQEAECKMRMKGISDSVKHVMLVTKGEHKAHPLQISPAIDKVPESVRGIGGTGFAAGVSVPESVRGIGGTGFAAGVSVPESVRGTGGTGFAAGVSVPESVRGTGEKPK